ncbi:sigma factor [Actinomadura pelletieri]|uniref:sigma factor n=1 Tax=Actinomadura pelletieri TaxID=111805 RepID=UPI001B873CF6|nr:sigma factor [Actinomadura pelletieri]
MPGRRGKGFDRRIEPVRTELLAYCYRMLGSVHDAEDLVQEMYLRAWRARAQYNETCGSVRTWPYWIATDACLTALHSQGRQATAVGAGGRVGSVRQSTLASALPDSLLPAGARP